VTYGFDNVACAGLTFRANEGCAFGDATKSFAQITCTADERYFEGMLIDVVLLISRSQNLRFVDVIDPDRLKDLPQKFNIHTDSMLRETNLRFDKMPDTDFSHYRYGYSFDYFLDHTRITLRSTPTQLAFQSILAALAPFLRLPPLS
jgi:hypothetical protein